MSFQAYLIVKQEKKTFWKMGYIQYIYKYGITYNVF